MGVLAFISVLKARKLLIAWATLVGAATALALGLIFPKEYVSTAKVQVDSMQQNLLTGFFEPRYRVSEFLGQQAAVAGSRTVALEVVDTLTAEGVLVLTDFESDWRGRTKGEMVPGNDLRLWVADQLLRKLTVEADALESTIAVSFRAEDPAQAARVANAFANAYMQIILDKRQRRAARNAANFSEETRSLEVGLEQASRDLSDFREESGIVGLGAQRLESAEVELASLTMRLAEARADLSEARSLLRQAREASANELLTLPLPHDDHAGRQTQSRLGAVMAQIQRISERYGEQYPDYIEAVNSRRALERTIMEAVEDREEYASRRVLELDAAAIEKKREVVALQEVKQQYNLLENKLDTSRATYDLAATRSLQEQLQSRVDVVDVLLLARAVPSDHPITLPLILIMTLGIVAGIFLGAGVAVVIEFLEGRVRDPQVMSHLLRTTVMADFDNINKRRPIFPWRRAA